MTTMDSLTEPANKRFKALLALALLVPAPSIGTAAALYWWPGDTGKVFYGFCKVVLLVLPVIWFLYLERGKLSLSLPKKGGLLLGLISGLVIAAAILGFYALVGRNLIDAQVFRDSLYKVGFDSKALFIGTAIYVIVLNAALEEYVWRWFVFRQCEKLMPGLLAIFVSALLFTIHHIVALRAYVGWDITLISCAGLLIGATAWSALYWRYRSVWPGYISHVFADIAVYIIGWQILFPST
ncbi:MAG: CPBP family intramembrane metalloprotease [Planctomycetes bacterium]|nr:CPBP family intramembrane metalloprotease [Planctomycetota bacterium]